MSAKGKTAKETSTTGCGNEPSAPRDSVREERLTSFSEAEQEPATKMPRVEEFPFAGKNRDEIGKDLEDLFNGGDMKGLETAKKQLRSLAVTPRVEMGLSQEELIGLLVKASELLCILKERLSSQQGHVQVTSSKLGSMIHSLGFGSSAGRSENRETVDAVLTSYSSDDAFLQIARELQRLHELGYCHGDIRVSNLILHPVNGDKNAKLVDFDLAGKKGKQKYPYNLLNLVDGARHEDIQQAIKSKRVDDMTLQPEHDWSSLVAAMKCFEVKDKDDADTWEDLIKRVENSNFGDLNDEDLEQKVLKLNDKVIEQAKAATDSPKKGK